MKYLSCEHLRHTIHFRENMVCVCCQAPINTESNVYFPLIENYNGEKIDIIRLSELRNSYLDNIKSNIIPFYCNNCPELKEKDWQEYQQSINEIIISHWTNCNCNCIYCHLDKSPKKKPYKLLPVLKDLAEKKILNYDGYLLWGGGEPCCLNEFDEIMEFFYSHNIAHVQINSSGIQYNKTIAKYINRENTKLTISIDAPNAEIFKKIKIVDKYNQVLSNISKYVEAQKDNKFGVSLKYIILPQINSKKSDIKQWLEITKNLGVNSVILEIESTWFTMNGQKYINQLIDLYKFFEQEAKLLNLNIEYYALGKYIQPYLKI